MLTGHAEQGLALAREHLALLSEARGAYKLGNADLAGVITTWTTCPHRPDRAVQRAGPPVAGPRRSQRHPLRSRRRYAALVAEELALVDQILALTDELTDWTIEALLTKSDLQIGLEHLLGDHR